MTTFTEAATIYAEQARERAKARYKKAIAQCISEYHVEPTSGSSGRLHAPCDGYEWDGNQYLAGEFLPLHSDMIEWIELETGRPSTYDPDSYARKARVRMSVEEFEAVKPILKPFTVKFSKGATWSCGNCYVYIESHKKSLLDMIRKFEEDSKQLEKLRKGTAPQGLRIDVEGTVLSIKINRETMTAKVLVKIKNGATLYGTLPAKLCAAESGDVIAFRASFRHAKDDHTHAFFKRPTRAKFISTKEKKAA